MANYDLTYEGSEVQGILDTGEKLKADGYILMGGASPSTLPGTPTKRVAYIGGPGTYSNFGSTVVVPSGSIGVFKYDDSQWVCTVISPSVPVSTTVQDNDTTVPTGKAVKTAVDGAVDTLQGLIDGITDNIENGYVYAGIATPTTTPVTGKVFYLALQAGQYTHFDNTAVMQGINIFKYNGSSWLHDAYVGISDKPIPSDTGLVKAGGTFDFVMDNGSAFDISKHFASGSTLATYEDLSAALTDLDGLDAAYKMGGMSIRFVQSSDNKYVQHMCKTSTWSSTPADWEKVNNVSVSRNTETGNDTLQIGNTVGGEFAGGDKLIELCGIAVNAVIAGVSAVGDVFFNTSNKTLQKCIHYPFITNTDFEQVPFYKGAIYSYNGDLYTWNGNDLISLVNESAKNSIENVTSLFYGQKGDGLVWNDNKAVNALTNAYADLTGYKRSNKIQLSKNTLIRIKGAGNNIGLVTKVDEVDNIIKVVLIGQGAGKTHDYFIEEEGYYVLSYKSSVDNSFAEYYINSPAENNKYNISNVLDNTLVDPLVGVGIAASTLVRTGFAAFNLTPPLFVRKGEKIVVNTAAQGIALICESNNGINIIRALVLSDPNISVHEYVVPMDMYVVISYRNSGSFEIIRRNYINDEKVRENTNSILSLNNRMTDVENEISEVVSIRDTYIPLPYQLQPTSQGGGVGGDTIFFHTKPIAVSQGDILEISTKGGGYAVISETDENGSLFTPIIDAAAGSPYTTYTHTITREEYVSACCMLTSEYHIVLNGKELYPTIDVVDKIGIYMYPFRTIANKNIFIFKDSVVSGLSAEKLMCVTPVQNLALNNYSEKAILLNKPQGEYDVKIMGIDQNDRIVVQKFVKITVRNAPVVKLSNSSIDVLFMGDSLIGYNNNLIGKEWLRMLSTSGGASVESDGAKLLNGLNVCPNKINIVGEQESDNIRFQYFTSLRVAAELKRTIPYGDELGQVSSYWSTHNPFYNPDSTEPDEIGVDGFNKRVDFRWYFENACGVGHFPKIVYLAIGANDVGSANLWTGSNIVPVTEKFIALCKRMKAGADAIAGGESGMVIKVLNHQVYPQVLASENNLPINLAKSVQRALYDSYYSAISNPENGVSGYVELLDCASKFDWNTGYTKIQTSTNDRYNQNTDIIIPSCVHMNNVGAYNYADTLVYDFLADIRFD